MVDRIDATEVIIQVISMVLSYMFGKRRGRKSRVEPLSERDLKDIDRGGV